MKLSSKLFISYIAFIFSFHAFSSEDMNQLVKKADNIRNPAESYEMEIKVDTQDQQSVFKVYLKGQEKTLIVTKEPARDKGRNMLMLDRDFEVYVPNLKRSMKLSLSQKLSGQVANGDISRTRWYGDYEATKESETSNEIQLLLKGKKDNLTYAWIRMWLQKDNAHPLRAEYLGLNGKTVLKKASFEDYKSISGAIRPTTIKIEDTNKQVSYIRIVKMNVRNYEDSYFTVHNMETMK